MASSIASPVEELFAKLLISDEQLAQVHLDEQPEEERDPLKLTTAQKEALAIELVTIKAAKEELDAREASIKAVLRKVDLGKGVGATGTSTLHKGGGVTANLAANETVDFDKLCENFPYDYTEVVDVVEDKGFPFGKKVVPTTIFPNRKFYKLAANTEELKRLPRDPVIDPATGAVIQRGWIEAYKTGEARVTIRS